MSSADFYTSDIAVFVVGKTNSLTTNQRFLGKFDGEANREWLFDVGLANTARMLKNGSGSVGADNQIVSSEATAGTSYRVFSYIKDGTTGHVGIDGSVTTGSFATATVYDGVLPFRVGADETGNYLNGDMAEIIVIPRAVTTAERQQVERYLSNKYAIALA
jgi:hypothetical protein